MSRVDSGSVESEGGPSFRQSIRVSYFCKWHKDM